MTVHAESVKHKKHMKIDDSVLSFGAAIIEIIVPLAIIFLYQKSPVSRRPLLTAIGAVSPLLVFYLVVSISFIFSSSEDVLFSFYAMWAMSFVPYIGLVFIGLVVGYLVFRYKKPVVALLSGVVIGPLLWLGVLAFEQAIA